MRRLRHWGPGLLLLSPSLILLAVFVYGLIAWTTKLSVSDQHDALGSKGFVGLDNYKNLFTNDIQDRFTHSLKNLLIFTVVFLVGTMVFGLLWAFLLERGVRAEGAPCGTRSSCSVMSRTVAADRRRERASRRRGPRARCRPT